MAEAEGQIEITFGFGWILWPPVDYFKRDTSVLNWLLNYLKIKQIIHPRLESVDKSEIQKVYMKCSFDAFQGHVLPLVHNIG